MNATTQKTRTTVITGTKWLNASQLHTVKHNIANSTIKSINCGTYSNGDVVAVCTMTNGNIHSIHIANDGIIIPPYQHLK